MRKDVFDELVVVKRSGQRVNFNTYKVAVAIKSAFDVFKTKYNEKNINTVYENVLKYIEQNYISRKTINVEDIQDIIENELQKQKYFDVYKEFSEYRKKRAESRKVFKIKQQHKFAKAMEKINEANLLDVDTNYKPEEIINSYGHTVLNEFIKSYIIDNKYLRMHDEGNIYIHSIENASLGRVSHTNLILNQKLEECHHCDEILNYLISCQNEIDGEIHISSFAKMLSNCTLTRFKDTLIKNLTNYLELTGYKNYINIESIKNIVNNSNEIKLSDLIKNIALNPQVEDIINFAYENSLKEIKESIKQDLSYLINGLNKTNHPYSFSLKNENNPITNFIIETILEIIKENNRFDYISFIYKIENSDDKYLESIYELIHDNKNILIENVKNKDLEYFSNGIKIYDNVNDEDYSNGRMIISKCSINIARLGLISKNSSLEEFFNKFAEMLEIVKNELLLMFELIGNKNKDNFNILFDNNILYDEKLESGGKIRKVIKNSNLLIGLVGIKECVEYLDEDENKQYELMQKILKFANKKCAEYSEETKLNFYIYEPYNDKPRKYFMALDKSIYGIKKGITDKYCYELVSNSKILKNDVSKLSNIEKLFIGGNLIEKEIKENITYKKFIYIIEEMLDNNIGLIKFVRNTG